MNIFEESSLLGNIVFDLRPIIAEYIRTFPVFAIGCYQSSYPNYRIVDTKDFESKQFTITLFKYYREQNGLPAIDSLYGNVLCCDNFSLRYQSCYIRCTNTEEFDSNDLILIKIGNVVSFRTTRSENIRFQNIDIYNTGLFNKICKIGLYIRTDVKI